MSKTLLMVGNRGNKNLGDELILIGNLKLILDKKENIFSKNLPVCSIDSNYNFQFKSIDLSYDKIIIPTSDISWSYNFLLNFFDKEFIDKYLILVKELPHGIRSFLKFDYIKYIKDYFKVDDLFLGGGEILTDEGDGSGGWYFLLSSLPFFIKKIFKGGNIFLSGGIDFPKRWFNKFLFPFWIRQADKFFLRDFDSIEKVFKMIYELSNKYLNYNDYMAYLDRIYFMFDTSRLAFDRDKFLKQYGIETNLVGININPIGFKKFEKEYYEYIEKHLSDGKKIVYIPINLLEDKKFFDLLKNRYKDKIQLIVDWDKDWIGFIKSLLELDEILATRLHLFLISKYLNLNVRYFSYQNKISKISKLFSVKFDL